jgi:hypothetical protein
MSKLSILVLLAFFALMTMPASLAQAQEADKAAGTAVIWDSGAAISDSITYAMTDIPAPAAGTVYVGWLISDDGAVKLNTGGAMSVATDGSIDHSYTSPDGDDLIALYNKVAITAELEADADAAAPAGEVVYSHAVPLGAMAHIRHLVSSWPPIVENGILTDLKLQLDVAIQHANLARNSTDLAGINQHLEHVINAIEGPTGPNYGDLNGDGDPQDFGDGIGVLAHAQDRKHGPFAAGEAADDVVIVDGAALVDITGKNAEDWATLGRDNALNTMSQTSITLARLFLGPGANTVISALEAARDGFDGDGDGTIESIAGEGGADQAFVEAQRMATYTLRAGGFAAGTSVSAVVGPNIGLPSVGDSSVPGLAQAALIASLVLLSTGGLVLVRRRRSSTNA